jgi:hypothetical protein
LELRWRLCLVASLALRREPHVAVRESHVVAAGAMAMAVMVVVVVVMVEMLVAAVAAAMESVVLMAAVVVVEVVVAVVLALLVVVAVVVSVPEVATPWLALWDARKVAVTVVVVAVGAAAAGVVLAVGEGCRFHRLQLIANSVAGSGCEAQLPLPPLVLLPLGHRAVLPML